MFVAQMKSEVFFIQSKKWVNSWKWKVTKLGSRKLHICPKVTKMGSIIGNGIDYNGVGALTGQRHIPCKINPSNPPPPGIYLNEDLNQDWTSLTNFTHVSFAFLFLFFFSTIAPVFEGLVSLRRDFPGKKKQQNLLINLYGRFNWGKAALADKPCKSSFVVG